MKKGNTYRVIIAAVSALCAHIHIINPSQAELKVCNDTKNRVGVAVGYKDLRGWVSEGWWNLKPESCQQIIEGPLIARYYYIYASDYDEGGVWAGNAPICIDNKIFTIRGLGTCQKRGYTEELFFEVDTKEEKSWVVSLADTQKNNAQSENQNQNTKTDGNITTKK